MKRGYIKLWRKTIESGLMQNAEVFTFFVWALLKATHKSHKHLVGHQMVELEPGQFVTGIDAAAKELKTTPRKIRTALVTLEKLQILTRKTTNKFSMITLINWETYQPDIEESDKQSDKQVTNKRQADDSKQEHKHLRTKEVETIPPSFEDVQAQCKTKGYTFDPQGFYDHHEARGWVLGNKQKMKKWTSALSTWARNDKKFNGGSGSKQLTAGFIQPV